MKFEYIKNSKLPPLAWCALYKKESPNVLIYHGDNVETFETFFVEGAWDGEFKLGEFDQAEFFVGTGGKLLSDQAVLFSTPNHVLERLYTITVEDTHYVSNSLPFILYISNSKLDSDYLYYESDLNTILNGINNYKNYIPLCDGRKVNIYYYCNIIIDKNFNIIKRPKVEIKPFQNYDDYETRILQCLKKIVINGKSTDRKLKYDLITTISKGYDSAAISALAKEVGCNVAVTFNQPEKYKDDSGVEIAKRLGYDTIVTGNANDYLNNKELLEAEFVSSGELGSGIIFSSFEKKFKNKIVFIGERGDKIWDKNWLDSNKNFRFKNEIFPATSMIENRLKSSYILLPVALYGATQWPSIHKISNSEEMKPFSIGGDYDRPIPRRILESRGVDRYMFGINKEGAGFNYRFDNLKRIKNRMSSHSFESFFYYYKKNKRRFKIKPWLEYLWNTKIIYYNYFVKKIGLSKIVCNSIVIPNIPNPGAPSYLFNWGIHEMIKRYSISELK